MCVCVCVCVCVQTPARGMHYEGGLQALVQRVPDKEKKCLQGKCFVLSINYAGGL